MHTVILTGGVVRPSKLISQAIDNADLIIAADSGGRRAIDLGAFPEAVIGDLDSLDPEAQALLNQKGCRFITCSPEKDQTDTELALRYAVDQKASRITIIGGTEGDRLDHILANVFSVMDAAVIVKFVNGATEAWIAKGPASVKINGEKQDLLSLIPLTAEVSDVETSQLKYALHGETLSQNQARGVSNVLTAPEATVSFKNGSLLFVHIAGAN